VSAWVPLKVASVEHLTPASVVIELVPAAPPGSAGEAPSMAFRAGQHLVLRRVLGGLEGGAFSEWANSALAPGDVVEAMAPRGSFTPRLDPGARRRYVAVAAGSGITPVFSIVSTVLEVEPRSSVALWYVNRATSDAMLLEELYDLKDRFLPRLELLMFMSREERDVDLLNGRLDCDRLRRLLAELQPPGEVDEWYLCGPYAMVTELRAGLLAAGVKEGRVHMELFHVAGGPATAPRRPPARGEGGAPDGRSSEVTVVLNGRATRLRVPAGGPSVLDALVAARSDAPYSCRSGVCGTCRARVVSGSVAMDRCYALEPDETAAGYVLMCQSHPVTGSARLEVG
jgi:ring-1,2-phenylacetyl-CoA epoxidase subunit PaaE